MNIDEVTYKSIDEMYYNIISYNWEYIYTYKDNITKNFFEIIRLTTKDDTEIGRLLRTEEKWYYSLNSRDNNLNDLFSNWEFAFWLELKHFNKYFNPF